MVQNQLNVSALSRLFEKFPDIKDQGLGKKGKGRFPRGFRRAV